MTLCLFLKRTIFLSLFTQLKISQLSLDSTCGVGVGGENEINSSVVNKTDGYLRNIWYEE